MDRLKTQFSFSSRNVRFSQSLSQLYKIRNSRGGAFGGQLQEKYRRPYFHASHIGMKLVCFCFFSFLLLSQQVWNSYVYIILSTRFSMDVLTGDIVLHGNQCIYHHIGN